MPAVSPEFARQCQTNFNRAVKGSNLKKIQDSFTASVTFSKEDLLSWIRENDDADSFRITLGMYPDAEDGSDEYKNGEDGRMTTFIRAVSNGEERSVFNSGTLNP